MINFHTTSQASFREKRMLFQFESKKGLEFGEPDSRFRVAAVQGDPLSTGEISAKAVEGSVAFQPLSTHTLDEDVTTPEARTEGAHTRDIRVDVSDAIARLAPAVDPTAETHEALPASAPPPVAPPIIAEPPAEEPLELDMSAVKVTRTAASTTSARTDMSAARPATPPLNRQMERTIPTVITRPKAAQKPPKPGFFAKISGQLSGLFGKIAPPDTVTDQMALNSAPVNTPDRFRAPTLVKNQRLSSFRHSDVLYSENVKNGQTETLNNPTLTDRITRANSNDLHKELAERYPELNIGFDGQIGWKNPIQRFGFKSKLEKDPVLAALAHELQRRNEHVRTVQRIF